MQQIYLFLINPRSGSQHGNQVISAIEQFAARTRAQYLIVSTPANGDYSAIINQITQQSVTHVVVCGGDGTISAAVGALRQLPVVFGIIPRGSGNGLALAAGISRNPHKALQIIEQNHSIQVDAFSINGRFSCMLSGLGFDAQIAHAFDRERKRGFWKYVKLVAQHLLQLRTYQFRIKAPNREITANAYFISIANSNQFGNHFTIAPKASLTDGLLDVVVVERSSPLLLLFRVLWHIRFGRFTPPGYKTNAITYFQTAALQLHNPDGAPFHIDGDGQPTATSFNIQVIPGAYRLLVPGKSK